jgi:hypothetical protein
MEGRHDVTVRALVLAACLLWGPHHLLAQTAEPVPAPTSQTPAPPSAHQDSSAKVIAQFVGGGAIGLALHEGGHLLMASVFGADPGLKKVSFGPLPFFAISHDDVTPPREYAISAAGFWVQHASSEWLLTRRPGLRHDHAPVAKGLLAFNILASVAYATAAFGTFGPYERDTRAMADALDVDEPWVGVMILAPAALDAWRYVKPESRWAAWTSRALKVGAVLIVVRAAR